MAAAFKKAVLQEELADSDFFLLSDGGKPRLGVRDFALGRLVCSLKHSYPN